MNPKKLNFEPINRAHAIAEVVFFIKLSSTFTAAEIEKISDVQFQLEEELPKFKLVKKIETEFKIGNEQKNEISQLEEVLSGFEMQAIKKNGEPEWILRFFEDVVAVHCLDYKGWDFFVGKTIKYIQPIFRKIDLSKHSIDSIGLRYIDRFLFKGEPEKYDASLLFDNNCDFIFKKAFSAGLLWHCHSGWFENSSNLNLKCLNQLNIDSAYGTINSKKEHISTIDHNLITSMDIENSDFSYFFEKTNMESIMGELHSINKRVLSELLVGEMVKRINLGMEKTK